MPIPQPMPPAAVRWAQAEETAIIRQTVARHLDVPESTITNMTKLGPNRLDMVRDLDRLLNKRLPPDTMTNPDSDLASLLGLYLFLDRIPDAVSAPTQA